MMDRWTEFVPAGRAFVLPSACSRRSPRAPTASASSTTSPRVASTTRSPSPPASSPERDTFGNQNVDVVAIYTQPGPRRLRPGVPGRRRADGRRPPARRRRPRCPPTGDARRRAGEQGRPRRPGADLARRREPGRLPVQLRRPGDAHPGGARVDLQTDLAGAFAVFNDVNEITSEDLARAESISMPIVVLLALLIFGSLVAASMPALVGAARDGRCPRAGPRDHRRSPRSRSSRST